MSLKCSVYEYTNIKFQIVLTGKEYRLPLFAALYMLLLLCKNHTTESSLRTDWCVIKAGFSPLLGGDHLLLSDDQRLTGH